MTVKRQALMRIEQPVMRLFILYLEFVHNVVQKNPSPRRGEGNVDIASVPAGCSLLRPRPSSFMAGNSDGLIIVF